MTRARLRALPLLLAAVAACGAYVGEGRVLPAPGRYPVRLVDDPLDPTLPDGRAALIEIADTACDHGPAGHGLDRALQALQKVLTRDPRDGEAAWRAARILFFRGLVREPEHALDLSERCLDAAAVGMTYSDSAEAALYAAFCLGLRAQAKKREALSLIPPMLRAARIALERDPKVVHGGPHRMLGGIYLRAPAWPTSVGDLDKALLHLRRATEIAPRWPENRIMLAEALVQDDRADEARLQLDQARLDLGRPEVQGWRVPLEKRLLEVERMLEKDRGTRL